MTDWDDIRYFLAVARSGSVTAAARQLNVNHSTVSRRIRALESRYGISLFEHLPIGYTLTDDAAEIYELALQIEANNFQLERRLQGLDSRLTGRVTVTMPHDLFEFLCVRHLNEFSESYPDIVLDMQVAKGVKNLSAREADIAVRLTNSPPDYLIGRRICDMSYGIYKGAEFSETQTDTPVITWSDEDDIPMWAAERFPNAKVVMQMNDLLAMYSAVEAGLGIARMPVYMHNFVKSKSVVKLDSAQSTSNWGVWILSHVDLRNTARVQKCREFLVDVLQSNKHLF